MKKGFTLMEMLIVIAIIVVLIAISVPIITQQLEKSREAADIANMRDAKAAASAAFLTEEPYTGFYDAESGKIVTSAEGIKGYGKGTPKDGGQKYSVDNTCADCTYASKDVDYRDSILAITEGQDGSIHIHWDGAASSGNSTSNSQAASAGKTILDHVQDMLDEYNANPDKTSMFAKGKNSLTPFTITLSNGDTVNAILYNRDYDTFQDLSTRMKTDNTASLIYNTETKKLTTLVYYKDGQYSSWSITDDQWRDNDYYK